MGRTIDNDVLKEEAMTVSLSCFWSWPAEPGSGLDRSTGRRRSLHLPGDRDVRCARECSFPE